MACCKGNATWFCCYDDPCGCDACCCQGSNCSTPCGESSYCGVGACCTCHTYEWGYAWKYAGYCGMSPSCGDFLYFTNQCPNPSWYATSRRDTGPSSSAMVDLTKSFFLQFAPLSQGVIPNMVATNNVTCC